MVAEILDLFCTLKDALSMHSEMYKGLPYFFYILKLFYLLKLDSVTCVARVFLANNQIELCRSTAKIS